MEYLTKRIKKDIQNGGIVIAPRRAGKTVAIIDMIEQSDEYVLVCCTNTCANSIRKDFGPKRD